MIVSFYATPRITSRFWPVVMRNLLVWKKLAVPSVIGNIAEPLITLVAFGYGLGSMIGKIEGRPYIEFLASGSIAVSAADLLHEVEETLLQQAYSQFIGDLDSTVRFDEN